MLGSFGKFHTCTVKPRGMKHAQRFKGFINVKRSHSCLNHDIRNGFFIGLEKNNQVIDQSIDNSINTINQLTEG